MWKLMRRRRALRSEEQDQPRSRRARTRDRGAALLEFALIAPLFFLVVFGGIEIGLLFRSHLAVEDATRTAARVASVERDSAGADQAILERIDRLTGNLNGEITKVVIFNADTLASEIPADCLTASRANVCNFYAPTDGDVATVAGGPLETALLPENRRQFENLGIYIEYEYQFVTGFFDTTTLSSTSVEVVELDL